MFSTLTKYVTAYFLRASSFAPKSWILLYVIFFFASNDFLVWFGPYSQKLIFYVTFGRKFVSEFMESSDIYGISVPCIHPWIVFLPDSVVKLLIVYFSVTGASAFPNALTSPVPPPFFLSFPSTLQMLLHHKGLTAVRIWCPCFGVPRSTLSSSFKIEVIYVFCFASLFTLFFIV